MEEINKKEVEKSAVETMLDNGVRFGVDTRGLLSLLGKKQIKFHIRQPYLGTLLHISKIYLEMEIDEKKFGDNAYQDSYMLVPENARRMSMIIALAMINDKIRIKLFSKLLSNWLLWRLNPSKLFQLMVTVLTLSNTASFTNSIRLTKALRMMKPKEEKEENLSRSIIGV